MKLSVLFIIILTKIVEGVPLNSTSTVKSTTENTTSKPATGNIPDPCLMPMDPGPCYGKFTRFYFSKTDLTCKMFYYGGCYGTENRFQSLAECNFTCVDNPWPPYPIIGGGGDGDGGSGGGDCNMTDNLVILNPSQTSQVEVMNFEYQGDLKGWIASDVHILHEEVIPETTTTSTTTLSPTNSTESGSTTIKKTTKKPKPRPTKKTTKATTTVNQTSTIITTSPLTTTTTTTGKTSTTAKGRQISENATSIQTSTSTEQTPISTGSTPKPPNNILQPNTSLKNGTFQKNYTFSLNESKTLDFSLKIDRYVFDKNQSLLANNPFVLVELIGLPKSCPNRSHTMGSHETDSSEEEHHNSSVVFGLPDETRHQRSSHLGITIIPGPEMDNLDNRLSDSNDEDDEEEMMATVTIHPEEMVITEKWTTHKENEDSPTYANETSDEDKKSFDNSEEETTLADIVETTTAVISSEDDPDSWDGKMDEEMIMTVTPKDLLENRHLNEDNSESNEESHPTSSDCNNKTDHYVLFDLAQYGFYFNVTPGWANIRIAIGHHSVNPGNYTLKFTLRNGLGNVSLDNINITSTPEMKKSLEMYNDWSRTSTTITTTTTMNTTTSIGNTTTFVNGSTAATSTISRNTSVPMSTTTTNPNGVGGTNAPLTGNTTDASQVVLIVLLVAVSACLVGLSFKHHQTQKKLREYRVTRNVGQNFDNPLYSGQHTPADRYGSLHH